ncbi:MAG: hypothetical protein E7464_02755 [Ruminococcaceae bacterium]|nr:hypothetical protein [Oscillospiraceae bacterium]
MDEKVERLALPDAQEQVAEGEMCEIPRKSQRMEGLSQRFRMALALILSVAAVFCKLGSPDSAAKLQRWIIGDGSERVQQAFFRMEEALGEGESVSEAWTVFCQELTDETA